MRTKVPLRPRFAVTHLALWQEHHSASVGLVRMLRDFIECGGSHRRSATGLQSPAQKVAANIRERNGRLARDLFPAQVSDPGAKTTTEMIKVGQLSLIEDTNAKDKVAFDSAPAVRS